MIIHMAKFRWICRKQANGYICQDKVTKRDVDLTGFGDVRLYKYACRRDGKNWECKPI